jgi:hypothetical protein
LASRLVKHGGLVFEVWTKSLRLKEPKISMMFSSYSDLTKEDNCEKAINDFISIMNLGVELQQKMRFS